MNRYYRVVAKCGHVGGPKKYIPIEFYTAAQNGKEAAGLIRQSPRVKHDHKDAIRSVTEISKEEYFRGMAMFNADPYNLCKNPQEQKRYWDLIEPRVMEETEENSREQRRSDGACKKPYNAKRAIRYGYGSYEHPSRDCCMKACA